MKTKYFHIELEFSAEDYQLDMITAKKVMERLQDYNLCNTSATKCKGRIIEFGKRD